MVFDMHLLAAQPHCTKNEVFLLKISFVKVTKSAVSCEFGHTLWRSP